MKQKREAQVIIGAEDRHITFRVRVIGKGKTFKLFREIYKKFPVTAVKEMEKYYQGIFKRYEVFNVMGSSSLDFCHEEGITKAEHKAVREALFQEGLLVIETKVKTYNIKKLLEEIEAHGGPQEKDLLLSQVEIFKKKGTEMFRPKEGKELHWKIRRFQVFTDLAVQSHTVQQEFR